jgi:tetratricopeptide (TPR) repeat protein
MKSKQVKFLSILTLLFSSITAFSQDVAEIKKMYDYSRFETAKKLATPLSATNATANYYLGLSQLGLGKIADAKATFAKHATDIANICGTARALFAEKKITEGMALLNDLVSKAKKKDWQTYKLCADAITYSEGTNYTKAIEWYTKANSISANGETYMNLGDAYYNMPDGGGNAEVNYINALDNKADGSQVAYRRGNLWYSARNYDSAIANYKRCSELDANNPLPHLYFANSYYQKNRFNLAKESIEKYLSLSDQSNDDLLQYVNILYLSKDYPNALIKINELLKSGVEKPYLYRLAAYCNYETGNTSQALIDMDKFFVKQDKAKIIAMDYDYYSKILAKTPGRESEADTYFFKYLDLDSSGNKYEKIKAKASAFYTANDFTNAANWYGKLFEKSSAEQLSSTDYYYNAVSNYFAKNYQTAIPILKTMTTKFATEPSGFYYLGMSNAQMSEKKNLEGTEAFKKYAELVGSDSSKTTQLKRAYNYIIEYYYDAKDAVNATNFSKKLLEIDPANTYAPQIIEAMKSNKPIVAPKKK